VALAEDKGVGLVWTPSAPYKVLMGEVVKNDPYDS